MDAVSENQKENWLSFLLGATILSIPFSPTFKSIFIVITVGLILCRRVYRPRLFFSLSQPCSRAAIIFFGLAFLACLWSIASYQYQLVIVEKYSKLLYLPILAVGFSNKKSRNISLHAFLVAMLITSVVSMLKNWDLINYNGLHPTPEDLKKFDPGRVFHNHIITGYMIAFAAYLSGLFWTRSQGLKKLIYLSLALLFSYQVLFVNTGRTGYIIYFILFILLIIQTFSLRHIVGLFAYCLLLGGMITTIQTPMSHGLKHVIEEISNYTHNHKNTSVGFRLQFHQYAKSLFITSPWIGHGTGSFATQFHLDQPLPAWGKELADPHSQYWLIASEFGLLGLVLLGYFFISLLLLSTTLVETRPILLALLIPFFCANITNAFLTSTSIGYFFIIFSALCLGEFIEINDNYSDELKKNECSASLSMTPLRE